MPNPEDTRLHHRLKAILARYPNLAAVVPGGFFVLKKVTSARLAEYSSTRAERYWHNVNLPLVLHATESDDPRVRDLMGSLLRTFEDFAAKFRDAQGFKGTLQPLWQQCWSPDPVFWSAAAAAYVALAWSNRQMPVLRFEEPTGLGNADADLTVQLGTTKALVEIELEHLATLANLQVDDVKARLRRRADAKAGSKFPAPLPTGTNGVIAEVCVLAGDDVDWQPEASLGVEELADRPGVKWMALRLVGVRHPDGLRFAIMPLLPSTPAA